VTGALSTEVYRSRDWTGGWVWLGEVRRDGRHLHGTDTCGTKAEALAAAERLREILQAAVDAGETEVSLPLAGCVGTVTVTL
jgi:hypothetical protein